MAGEHLLFLTGIFPHFIEKRSQRRGAPGLSFYESVGGGSYRSAAQHPFSQKVDTTQLYQEVASAFPAVRNALNDVADRLLTIDWQVGLLVIASSRKNNDDNESLRTLLRPPLLEYSVCSVCFIGLADLGAGASVHGEILRQSRHFRICPRQQLPAHRSNKFRLLPTSQWRAWFRRLCK